MKQNPPPHDPDDARRGVAAHEVLDGEGAPVRAPTQPSRPTVDEGVVPVVAPPHARSAGVVDVIRRLRRGRWTLTEVYA